MGSVTQVVSPGAVLVTACVLVACAGLAVALVVRRSARRRREALDVALAVSREQVESLSRQVAELSDEVGRARRTADQDREYVITSLGSGETDETALAPGRRRAAQPVARVLEDQLVEVLARQPRSLVRSHAVDLVVRTVSLGHGVRRALAADVLDRAAAEAHVARRRSRRERKRQVRMARRLRTDRAPGREVA